MSRNFKIIAILLAIVAMFVGSSMAALPNAVAVQPTAPLPPVPASPTQYEFRATFFSCTGLELRMVDPPSNVYDNRNRAWAYILNPDGSRSLYHMNYFSWVGNKYYWSPLQNGWNQKPGSGNYTILNGWIQDANGNVIYTIQNNPTWSRWMNCGKTNFLPLGLNAFINPAPHINPGNPYP